MMPKPEQKIKLNVQDKNKKISVAFQFSLSLVKVCFMDWWDKTTAYVDSNLEFPRRSKFSKSAFQESLGLGVAPSAYKRMCRVVSFF